DIAVEQQVLSFIAEDELLPQAGHRRVRGVLVERGRVVGGDGAVGGNVDGQVDAAVGEVVGPLQQQVVPVDDDRGLSGLDGAGFGFGGHEVALVRELLEVVDAGLDVIKRSAVGQGRGE